MVSSGKIVRRAFELGLMVPAFNIPYLPMMEPVVRAVVDEDSFAFIDVARLEWIKFESGSLAQIAREFTRCADLNHLRLHLDHVPVIDEDDLRTDYAPIFEEAIKLGYHSLMIDGSRLDLDGNIAATKQICDLAHAANIPCEAELGAVFGHEQETPPPYEELFATGKGFTDVDEAVRFASETGCDWLSVAIGNVHGAISKGAKDKKKIQARLNLEHLMRLRDALDIPLVLHGGSGIRQDNVLAALKCGIAKVNVATEIRQAYEQVLPGGVEAAQNAVYDRTRWLIREHFGISGTRSALTAGE